MSTALNKILDLFLIIGALEIGMMVLLIIVYAMFEKFYRRRKE